MAQNVVVKQRKGRESRSDDSTERLLRTSRGCVGRRAAQQSDRKPAARRATATKRRSGTRPRLLQAPVHSFSRLQCTHTLVRSPILQSLVQCFAHLSLLVIKVCYFRSDNRNK